MRPISASQHPRERRCGICSIFVSLWYVEAFPCVCRHFPASLTSRSRAKQPEACPHCGSHVLTRRGTRRKKLEIVQLWRCASCKRVFTPGPAALRNRTYPLRMILSALTDYDIGYTLQETAARLKKKTNRSVSPSTIAAWLEEYKRHCSYRRLRAQGLMRFPANQTIRSIKLYHRQVYSYAYHRAKLTFLRDGALDDKRAASAASTARFAPLADFLEIITLTKHPKSVGLFSDLGTHSYVRQLTKSDLH